MNEHSVLDVVSRCRVIPVIAIESVEAALPLADALLEGGLPIIEITFRTAAARAAIERIASRCPDVLIGAGTVLSIDNLQAAIDSGARFAVAPGLNMTVVEAANDANLPMIPGVATASEVELALSLGCRLQKFFPSEALGGVKMLKALSGPYAHTGVKFVPTGGVTTDNLESYLSLGVVEAVGGTWIAKTADIKAERWSEIRDRCRAAMVVVARLRNG
jgi:2-dehydro-3-deoxyphosphogluconate aldolase/(4S)-4-hydroxy-2-oxoglutarate aldolase